MNRRERRRLRFATRNSAISGMNNDVIIDLTEEVSSCLESTTSSMGMLNSDKDSNDVYSVKNYTTTSKLIPLTDQEWDRVCKRTIPESKFQLFFNQIFRK